MSFSNKIILKTDEEIEIIRQNGKVIASLFEHFKAIIKPGISTFKLDSIAYEWINDHQATPSFKGYGGFPASICTSLNEVVIHGIPSKIEVLKEGDILGIDVGVYKNGFHSDSAFTFMVGEVNTEVQQLIKTTKQALALGISAAKYGRTLFDIAKAIQQHVNENNFGIVKNFVGHGIGKNLHEPPQVPNYVQSGLSKIRLQKGMVIAIEPMVTINPSGIVYTGSDDWSVYTQDHSFSAHFEHTIAITTDGPVILTSL